ncbi:hypothetical protein H6P81_000572 [Aristolochia fimbriata]|uniref:Tetraspanin-15-like n=1 Tax=Aristolochia fimbriata TaxID=158543 RepID=A0AAV7F5U0_ARIFI|nr:hypothetical protein H6P81_000572 [Aristolochia fimbriata]
MDENSSQLVQSAETEQQQAEAPPRPPPSETPKPISPPPLEAPSRDSQLPCESKPAPPPGINLKKLIGVLTVVCFLLSLPLLAAGISSLYMRDYDCESLLHRPQMRLALGVAMILVFIISNLVIYYGSRFLMPGLLAATIPLMVMFIVGLSLSGAYTMESRAVPNSPMWLKLRIGKHGYWTDIKTCVYRSQVCSDLSFRMTGLSAYQFSTKKLTMIESGCCKPPAICGMHYVNATCWINTRKSREYQDLRFASKTILGGDCSTWDNAESKLCFDCQACKLGFLRTLQQRWRRLGVFISTMALLLLLNHALIFVAHLAEKKNVG